MSRLPDRFDLWVRKARDCRDPERQIDYVLGALAGLREWHFLNVGTKEKPAPAQAEAGTAACLLVFSDTGRIEEMLEGQNPEKNRRRGALPVITMPAAAAMAWCVAHEKGLLVNPGEEAVVIPFAALQTFLTQWSARGGRLSAGFWIPNLTTEEEDFWREHGL